jgi:hypothetical protein
VNDFTDRPEGRPSELRRDQLSLDELEPARALRTHIDACEHCRPLIADRAARLEAFTALASNRARWWLESNTRTNRRRP